MTIWLQRQKCHHHQTSAAGKFAGKLAKGSPKPLKAKGPKVSDPTKKKLDFYAVGDGSEADAGESPAKSMKGLAVHQASMAAEKAMKSPLPSVGFNLRGVMQRRGDTGKLH